jgi:hypothetical protein
MDAAPGLVKLSGAPFGSLKMTKIMAKEVQEGQGDAEG